MKNKFPPPWIKHPDIRRFSIGWRMGRGEFYLQEWFDFFENLNQKEKRVYKKENPEIIEWRGFYNLNSSSKVKQTIGMTLTFCIFILQLFLSIITHPIRFIKDRISY